MTRKVSRAEKAFKKRKLLRPKKAVKPVVNPVPEYEYPEETAPDINLKGIFGGNCNFTRCQAPGAYFYNVGSMAYYCRSCATTHRREVMQWGDLYPDLPERVLRLRTLDRKFGIKDITKEIFDDTETYPTATKEELLSIQSAHMMSVAPNFLDLLEEEECEHE